ncbi:MAG: response regulator [Gammaproteobacteria bacterium]
MNMTDEEILGIFFEEAQELIESISASLNAWASDYKQLEPIKNIKRDLHTLKGSARFVKKMPLAEKAHELESFYESLIEKNNLDENDYQRSLGQQTELIESLEKAKAPKETEEQDSKSEDNKKTKQKKEYLKIRADLVDNLNNLTEEFHINLSKIFQKNMVVSKQLIEFEKLFSKIQNSIKIILVKVSSEYKKLLKKQQFNKKNKNLDLEKYTEVYELSLSMEEIIGDIVSIWHNAHEQQQILDRLVTEQQRIGHKVHDDLIKIRTTPLSIIVPRLTKLIQQVSTSLGKKVNFLTKNLDLEIDRKVFEKLLPALEHLIRNAIDHGVELPEQRLKNNKSEIGNIKLTVEKKLNEFLLELSDDGAGIDLEKVLKKARDLDYLRQDNRNLSEQEILQFIFLPGFSTKQELTAISGRGIGMDVVAAQISSIGGEINIKTRLKKGTSFVLKIPLALSLDRAVFFSIGEQIYGVQSTNIVGVSRIEQKHLPAHLGANAVKFQYGDKMYRLRLMSQLLGASLKTSILNTTHLPVLILKALNLDVAVVVDRVLGSQEVTIKKLGNQFSELPEYAGAVVRESGQVIIILNTAQLLTKDKIKKISNENQNIEIIRFSVEKNPVSIEKKNYILVVDDSLTVRKVTANLLEKNGFLVKTAKDGLEALELIDENSPSLLVSDIEMPRMDGFELVETLKKDLLLSHIPIIMITSRVGIKHRERAYELGVNSFMTKPYGDEELLQLIKRYTYSNSSSSLRYE